MVAIVLISAIAVIRPPVIQLGTQNPSSKAIEVTGTATVSAPPEQAVLQLAVRTQAASAQQATSDNAAAMTKVIQALSGLGIDKKMVQTTSYTLSPIYENNPNQSEPSKIIGYAAQNTIQVTLTDLTTVGTALDAAVSAGANDIESITFTLSSATLASLQKQALGEAVQDADAQAKAVASSLGVSIIGPTSVSPEYMFQPNYQRLTAAPQAITPIQPGALEVTATVQVTYQFA
jgi:uncharacterized protein YggE